MKKALSIIAVGFSILMLPGAAMGEMLVSETTSPYLREVVAIYQPHGTWRQMKYLAAVYAKPSELANVDISYAYPISKIGEDKLKLLLSEGKLKNFGYGVQLDDGSTIVYSEQAIEDLLMNDELNIRGKTNIVSASKIPELDSLLKSSGDSAKIISNWNDKIWTASEAPQIIDYIIENSDKSEANK